MKAVGIDPRTGQPAGASIGPQVAQALRNGEAMPAAAIDRNGHPVAK